MDLMKRVRSLRWLRDEQAREAVDDWIAAGGVRHKLESVLCLAVALRYRAALYERHRRRIKRRDRALRYIEDFAEWLAPGAAQPEFLILELDGPPMVFDKQRQHHEQLTALLRAMVSDARTRDRRGSALKPAAGRPSTNADVDRVVKLGFKRPMARRILANLNLLADSTRA